MNEIEFKNVRIGEIFKFHSRVYTKMDTDRGKTDICDFISFWYIFKGNEIVLK